MSCPSIRLAAEGPVFSRIVAGVWRIAAWNMDAAARLRYIESCLELGVTSFDHADIYGDYGAQALFGEGLALRPGLRERMQLVSKCGIRMMSKQRPEIGLPHYDTGRAHIVASAERSLREMGTDRLDLLLIHRPDPLMDFDEIAEAFMALKASGKVLHFGVSNFTPSQFAGLSSRIPLVTNQVEFSAAAVQCMYDGTFDQLQEKRIAPMIWSPLAGGRLVQAQEDALSPVRAKAAEIGAQLGVSAATAFYAWIMRLPCKALPIAGSGRIEAIAEAVKATSLELSREHWFALLEAAVGHPPP